MVLAMSFLLSAWTAIPVLAHAELVETSPANGSVVETPPAGIELRFSEPVVPGGITLRTGDEEADGETRVAGATVTFVPDEPIPHGTALLDWRVTSADGHPISGTLAFHVGEVTETPIGDQEGPSRPGAVAVANFLTHLGLLLGGGLALFRVYVAGSELGMLRRWARALLVVGTFGALAGLAWRWADAGGGVAGLPSGTIPTLATLLPGVTVAVILTEKRAAVSLGVLAALASLVFTGHTRTADPTWLVAGSDLVHAAAGSVWAGGLLGLALVLRRRSGTPPAGMLARFSRIAGWALLGVLASGAVLTWRIHGSWQSLTGTSHGRVVLAKLGIVVAVAVVGAVNRYRFLPSITAGAGRLATTTAVEAAGLALVLVLAGALVELDPSPQGEQSMFLTGPVQVSLSDLALGIELEPGRAGVNLVRIVVRAPGGDQADLADPPRIAVIGPSGQRTGYGTVPVEGGYEGTIELPPAPWEIEIRVGTSDESVQKVRWEEGRLASGSGLLVFDAVMTRPPAGTSTAAVYLSVVSHQRDLLVGASSPVCRDAVLHESVINDDGTASMVHRDRIELSEDVLVFEPGGLHIMCEEVTAALELGDTVPFSITTAAGETLDFLVTVVDLGDIHD